MRIVLRSLVLAAGLILAACGGGGGGGGTEPPPPPPPPTDLAIGNATTPYSILNPVPADADGGGSGGGGGGGDATSLTVHYKRLAGDYDGWQLYAWDAAQVIPWPGGYSKEAANDSFGAIYKVSLAMPSGTVGMIFHKGDTKDNGGVDQHYTLHSGANEIWRIEGDSSNYTSNPSGAGAPDIKTLRVHYLRYANDFSNWGLHLWGSSGIDTSRLAGLTLEQWDHAVAFNQMPGYSAVGTTQVDFDLPLLNPQGDSSRKSVEFIIHGQAPNQNDKDGRPDNIHVDYAGLTIVGQVAEVWLVQGDPTVYSAAPDTRSSSLSQSRAVWLNQQLIRWPRVSATGTVKLYYSATGQVKAKLDTVVSGADSSITLDAFTGTVPDDAATRFKWVSPGAVFAVRAADQAQLPAMLKGQLVLVQEDSTGKVQGATNTQIPGAIDALYGSAATVNDLGATVSGGSTKFKIWAPTAKAVRVFTYDTGTGNAVTVDSMAFDAATGVWSATRSGDLSGKYYRFAVDVFARGVGLVRNMVTDPYSLSLTLNSTRSYIADMNAAALKPAGWDASTAPATVAAATDMVVYELHLRDFSANDPTVSAANRGKYLAFTEAGSNGMKHLTALAAAGLTDVHLMPLYDFSSVPEAGCTTPAPTGAADSDSQQATVVAAAAGDCYNWGYDPFHFNAPEGSYASDALDGAKRIVEFRAMVKGLHDAGLRVGMDVVFNHTSASGQNANAILDRVVPGYYHRLDANGVVENSTCCDNTAAENLMMGKLVSDSLLVWARDYKVSSFRFDVMGHLPRSVLEAAKARLKTELGHEVQFLGEGWNFGEVADGARFVQASMFSLQGSGIGSFNPFIRDAVRGGSPFDSGAALVANQGYINGLFYDPNGSGASRTVNDLMWQGDLIKAGLAGSIADYNLKTNWDETKPLSQINGAGYASDPSEAVNYIENHDNQTLFDNNAMKLPSGTSAADRARVQMLGAALNAFSQGVSYFHAGVDTLRSKSEDRNSYESGDWFNRIDWSYNDNYFGTGLPPAPANGSSWGAIKPFLTNANIKPAPADIAWSRDTFRDLLKIRASSSLFRLRTAADIKSRLVFHNTGSTQVPTVLVGQLQGGGLDGAGFAELVYLVNVSPNTQLLTIPALAGKGYELHPVHVAAAAADTRARDASYVSATGAFSVPARTAVVFVKR